MFLSFPECYVSVQECSGVFMSSLFYKPTEINISFLLCIARTARVAESLLILGSDCVSPGSPSLPAMQIV